MKFFKKIAFASALISAAALSSCTSSSDSEAEDSSSVTSAPIIVSEVDFYSARYAFSFVTGTGQIVKISPLGGSGTGGEVAGVMTVNDLTVPVRLEYDLEGDFFEVGDAADPEFTAIGVLRLTFTDGDPNAVAFFREFGVTFTAAAEDEAFVLPNNSGFIISLFYLNPDGDQGMSTLQSIAPLSTEEASWESALQGVVENQPVEQWLEGVFLQGAYLIERNQ